MYHLTILWLIIVAGAATVAYLAGWRRGRRFEAQTVPPMSKEEIDQALEAWQRERGGDFNAR